MPRTSSSASSWASAPRSRPPSAARWIRSCQREDGTWANFYGGPPELSTTVEAYVALRLAGDDGGSRAPEARGRVHQGAGGVERTRVFTRIWLALFGLWSWDELPVLPPELMFLPKFVPLNIYDFGCWARQTVVALSIVCAHRPVHDFPFAIDELKSGLGPLPPAAVQHLGGTFRGARPGPQAVRDGGRSSWCAGRP